MFWGTPGGFMRQPLLATVSTLALIGTASAADLPRVITKAPPAAIAPTWTGPYIGLNGGVAWHRAKLTYTQFAPFFTDDFSFTEVGATAGAQVGYNWQWQNFVAGIEADLNWVDGGGARTFPGVNFSTSLDRLATIRARVGITLSPTLVYVTGGFARGRVENTSIVGPRIFVDRDTRSGWTAGGGIEHMFASNWTAKAEVLYVDLGSSPNIFNGGGYTSRFRNTAIIGRLGLNLRW
jgi:outer membrane immunogenic protein